MAVEVYLFLKASAGNFPTTVFGKTLWLERAGLAKLVTGSLRLGGLRLDCCASVATGGSLELVAVMVVPFKRRAGLLDQPGAGFSAKCTKPV